MIQIDPIDQKIQPKPVEVVPSSGPEEKKGQVDVMLLAFMLLLEAASVNSHGAILHAKQLQANASAQQRLNNEEAHYKWHSIPEEQVKQWTTKRNTPNGKYTRTTYFKPGWDAPTMKHHYRYTKDHHKKILNQGAIDEAQVANEQTAKDRATIQDKLKVLQQEAQGQEGSVNSQVNESMQDIQESSNLMDILQSLTFQALLRKPTR